jgi:hypothetical protein
VVETSSGRESSQPDQELELKQSIPRTNCSIDRAEERSASRTSRPADRRSSSRIGQDDSRSASRGSRLDRPNERSASRNSGLDRSEERSHSRCSQLDGPEERRSSQRPEHRAGRLDRVGSRGSSRNNTLERGLQASSCDHSEIQVLTEAARPSDCDESMPATITPAVQLGSSHGLDSVVTINKKLNKVNGLPGSGQPAAGERADLVRVTSSNSCASPGSGSTACSGQSAQTRKGLHEHVAQQQFALFFRTVPRDGG